MHPRSARSQDDTYNGSSADDGVFFADGGDLGASGRFGVDTRQGWTATEGYDDTHYFVVDDEVDVQTNESLLFEGTSKAPSVSARSARTFPTPMRMGN